MREDIIYFAKVKEGAKIPSKREEDGAFDIYALFDEDYMIIPPQKTVMIPTGLASAFSTKYVAILKERGSTGSIGLGLRCGVIDAGYRGEYFVAVTNHNDIDVVILKGTAKNIKDFGESIIYPYEKAICQCVMVEVPKLSVVETSYEDLLKFESERGTGRLGSSGK